MEKKIDVFQIAPDALKPLFVMGNYLKKSAIEDTLKQLIVFRVSQINGCAYCLDMHHKDARAKGETEQRLYGLSAWREAPYYSERERTAFAWAEAVTNLTITDEVYQKTLEVFGEKDMIDLTMVITNINTWNRINIAFPANVGTYQVGQFG